MLVCQIEIRDINKSIKYHFTHVLGINHFVFLAACVFIPVNFSVKDKPLCGCNLFDG